MVSLKTVKEYLYFYYYLLQGAIFLFFAGRIETLKGNIDAVSNPLALGKNKPQKLQENSYRNNISVLVNASCVSGLYVIYSS